MSYSFSITADNKTEAKQKIVEAFDNIVNGQPPHAADRAAAVACGQAFVDILAEPTEGVEIHVSMYGSLGWRAQDEFTSASFNANASLRSKG